MRDGLRRGLGVVAAGTALALGAAAREAQARDREADLRDAVALITGGSRGLGLALSRELSRQGCRLAICARDETELEAARVELEQSGAEVLAVPCDVADTARVAAMVEAVTRHYGRIDILINNAGIIVVAPVETLTRADFERVMNVNFWGVLNPTLEVLPGMRTRGAGGSSTSPRSAARSRSRTCCRTTAPSSPRSDCPRGCGRSWRTRGSA